MHSKSILNILFTPRAYGAPPTKKYAPIGRRGSIRSCLFQRIRIFLFERVDFVFEKRRYAWRKSALNADRRNRLRQIDRYDGRQLQRKNAFWTKQGNLTIGAGIILGQISVWNSEQIRRRPSKILTQGRSKRNISTSANFNKIPISPRRPDCVRLSDGGFPPRN